MSEYIRTKSGFEIPILKPYVWELIGMLNLNLVLCKEGKIWNSFFFHQDIIIYQIYQNGRAYTMENLDAFLVMLSAN